MRSRLPSADQRFWTVLAFGGFLLLGLMIAPDYGLYIDEYTNHFFGVTWYEYVRDIMVNHVPIAPLANVSEHDVIHGPVFEMTLAWLQKVFMPEANLRTIVTYRHYATWLAFYLAVVAVYRLGRRVWTHRGWALAASGVLVLQPRIFAHSFFDSVDISFLAFYTVSVLTLVRYLERRTWGALVGHAVVCAVCIDVRSLGGVIPILTLGYLVLEFLLNRKTGARILPLLGRVGVFGVTVAGAMILFWPFLWTNPVLRFWEVLQITPRINWQGVVLYAGEHVPAPELPWHYIPVWILISTPMVCSLGFAIGLVAWFGAALQNARQLLVERRAEWVIVAALVVPLALVILMDAVVYDSWRHLFFIYPMFALIAVAGFRLAAGWCGRCLAPRNARIVQAFGAAVIVVNLASVGWFMVRHHPYQNVYFNRLAGRDMTEIKARFEMDFWGLATLEGLEHVLATNPGRTLKLHDSSDSLLGINKWVVPAADQARIQGVSLEEAEFVITNFRGARAGYPDLEEVYRVDVDGASIMSVYRKAP